jgi:hypothetical protein
MEDTLERAPAQVERRVVPVSGPWEAFVRGWRPFGGWVCGAILLARGVVIPITQLCRGEPVDPLDWVSLIALVGVLGLSRDRQRERLAGVTG